MENILEAQQITISGDSFRFLKEINGMQIPWIIETKSIPKGHVLYKTKEGDYFTNYSLETILNEDVLEWNGYSRGKTCTGVDGLYKKDGLQIGLDGDDFLKQEMTAVYNDGIYKKVKKVKKLKDLEQFYQECKKINKKNVIKKLSK